MGAATIVVLTTGGALKWAAPPCKTVVVVFVDTATGGALRASVVIITNSFWAYRRWG